LWIAIAIAITLVSIGNRSAVGALMKDPIGDLARNASADRSPSSYVRLKLFPFQFFNVGGRNVADGIETLGDQCP